LPGNALRIRGKATFRSNKTKSQIQQFSGIADDTQQTADALLHGFTAVNLGYQPGDAVSNIVNPFGASAHTVTYLKLSTGFGMTLPRCRLTFTPRHRARLLILRIY
jgi:hypothetical protein